MKNILVAIDQRKDADQLLTRALQIARLTRGKLWIIHVTKADPDDFLAKEAGPQYKYEKRAAKRKEEALTIKAWAQEIEQEHGISAEGLLIEGSITDTIKKLVLERDIELVVAGHKKKNLIYGLFTSNHKKDLVDVLQIPLLAVPLV